jgi:hypothetical protein
VVSSVRKLASVSVVLAVLAAVELLVVLEVLVALASCEPCGNVTTFADITLAAVMTCSPFGWPR